MNKEAHNLVAEIQKQVSSSALSIPQQNAFMARLLVLIAEDMDRQTIRLIRLTWALVFVSVALLAFGIAQTLIMLKQDAHTNTQQVQSGQTQKNQAGNQ